MDEASLDKEIGMALGRYRQLYVWNDGHEIYIAAVNNGDVESKAYRIRDPLDLVVAEQGLRARGGRIINARLPKKYWRDAGYPP